MTKHILVAYDGSAPAERAFDFALTLARALEADIYVLAVARPPEPPDEVETEAVLENLLTIPTREHRPAPKRRRCSSGCSPAVPAPSR